MTTNRRQIAVLLCFSLAGFLLYAGYVEPYWVEVTRTPIGQMQDETSSIVIAQVSDLHLKDVGALESAVLQRVQEIEPDVLILSGDVIDKPESLEKLGAFLSRLKAAHKIAILGNWEYWSGVDLTRLRKIYKENDFELLVNASAPMATQSAPLMATQTAPP